MSVKAPWPPDQVEALNRFQACEWVHPFTCGQRDRATHPTITNGDFGVLIATENGWICPDCDYTQDWAHAHMLSAPPDPFADWRRELKEDSK